MSGSLANAGLSWRGVWVCGSVAGWSPVAGMTRAVGPNGESVGVMEELTVVEGLPAIESQPVAPADGAVGRAPAGGMTSTAGPDEEAVGVVGDSAGAEGAPAIERQPAAPPTKRIASAARAERAARNRWRGAGCGFGASSGLSTSTR